MSLRILGERRSDEDLVVDDSTSFHFLGDGTVLVDCTLTIKVPAQALSLAGLTMQGGTVRAPRPLRGFDWWDTRLEGVRFEGEFFENNLGKVERLGHPAGALEDCDFTGATLVDCQLYGCDPRSQRFAGWPQFVLLDPHEHYRALAADCHDEDLEILFEAAEYLDEGVVALAYHASALKKRGLPTGELRKVLSRHGGAWM